MKALIAMSGGVDSSVAAWCMIRDGWDCLGCTMKLHEEDSELLPSERTCCTADDAADAASVARRLGFRHYTFNYTKLFRERVMEPFAADYLAGRTPNPCIECNTWLKFGALHQRARELGCDCVVTGHYARIVRTEQGWELRKAADAAKDQSYFLHTLTQEQLAHTAFPLGEMTKTEVRAIAGELGFVNAQKTDSQDICFVPDGDYADVVCAQTGCRPEPGPFLDLAGRQIGTHRGILHYTVGQRRGLGLSFPEPYYVVAIDAGSNTVTLGPKAALYGATVRVSEFHWISGQTPTGPIRCRAKIRYRHPEQPCTLTPTADGGALLQFDEPQRAVTPGQFAVAYDGETVLGGGRIVSE